MSSTEITLTCDHDGCAETFATGRSLWKHAAIEGREAGWETSLEYDFCPEHRSPEPSHE